MKDIRFNPAENKNKPPVMRLIYNPPNSHGPGLFQIQLRVSVVLKLILDFAFFCDSKPDHGNILQELDHFLEIE